MNNKFIKILCSLPIIFIFLYLIPFVGICLILLRAFVYTNKSKISTPLTLIGVGIVIYIPKIVNYFIKLFNFNISKIPYLEDVLNSDVYNINFIKYSKYLIISGVILLIISFALKSLIDKVQSNLNLGMNKYIDQSVKKEAEVLKQNDLEMKIRQEKVKNTSYVKCPKCGSDNILSEKTGRCKYCRGVLENKKYD